MQRMILYTIDEFLSLCSQRINIAFGIISLLLALVAFGIVIRRFDRNIPRHLMMYRLILIVASSFMTFIVLQTDKSNSSQEFQIKYYCYMIPVWTNFFSHLNMLVYVGMIAHYILLTVFPSELSARFHIRMSKRICSALVCVASFFTIAFKKCPNPRYFKVKCPINLEECAGRWEVIYSLTFVLLPVFIHFVGFLLAILQVLLCTKTHDSPFNKHRRYMSQSIVC